MLNEEKLIHRQYLMFSTFRYFLKCEINTVYAITNKQHKYNELDIFVGRWSNISETLLE